LLSIALFFDFRLLKQKHEAVFKSYIQHRDSSSSPSQPTMDGFMSTSNKWNG